MTQTQLLEFLSQLAAKGVVVTVNLSVNIVEDRQKVSIDDEAPVAPPDIPDFSYWYGAHK